MSQICPTKFFCINKNTFISFIVICIIAVLYFINNKTYKLIKKLSNNKNNNNLNNLNNNLGNLNNNINRTLTHDLDYQRIYNPLLPPERSYPTVDTVVPINIPTRGHISRYQQIGVLTNNDGDEPIILPLYGKPTYPGSSKWLYYTSTDKFPSIKLPVLNNSKDCQNEYGCKEIYESETINVPSYNKDFSVSIYQYDKPRYIPVI